MLDKIRSIFHRKESRVYQSLTLLGLDQPIWTPRDYENLTRAGFAMNVDVYACVSLITRSARPVPFLCQKTRGGSALPDSHPLVKLLRRPNELQSESDFKESALAYLLISGNEYIERSGGAENTPPAFIYPHRPDRFRVKRGNRRQLVSGYEYKAMGEPVIFQPWEILHLKLFNPLDDWYGMSPLEAAAYLIDNSNESQKLYKRLLQKGYPPGAVTIKSADYTDQQIADLKVGLRRAADNGEILLLQDAEWREMGFKPVDASLFEGRLFTKRDIGAIYGVPSGMIGDTEVKTYANHKEERRSLYTEAVIPALTKLCEGLTAWLGPLYDGAVIDIDKDAIDALAEDRDTQATRVSTLFKNNLIKRSEGREELKYDAIPEEEDGYYTDLSSGSAAPDQAQNDPAQDPLRQNLPAPAAAVAKPSSRREPIPINSRREDPGDAWGFKSFNLLSEEQKDNHWKAVEEHRQLWEQRVSADVEERFLSERDAVLKAFRDSGETAAIRAVTRQEDSWNKLYKSTILAVAEDFGRRTVQSIKSDGYDDYEVKFGLDIFTRTVLDWILLEGAKRVVGILDTTKDQIRKELATGTAAGEGIFELSKRLQAMYQSFSMVRAERISRTEVISASNLGSQTAARATNLPLEKEWLSTLDKRTRDPHRSAHGQKRSMDEPYIVMGEKLKFPGDGSLGATGENLINCRCTETYRVKRG